MRENRLSGSEGGGTKPIVSSYPYLFIMSESQVCAIARFACSVFLSFVILGFRSAPPQALCFHPLRGFWKVGPY